MEKKRRRTIMPRRRLVIDRPFQLRFIFRIILFELFTIIMTVLVASFFTIFIFHKTTISSGVWGETLVYNVVILVLIMALISIWRSALASNRIAGPLYRLRTAFAQVGKGDLGAKVTLRPKDELHEMAWAFNDMLEGPAERVERQREILSRIEAVADGPVKTHLAELKALNFTLPQNAMPPASGAGERKEEKRA